MFILIVNDTYKMNEGVYPSFGYPFYYILIDLFDYILNTMVILSIPFLVGLIVFIWTKNIDKTISYMVPIIVIIYFLFFFIIIEPYLPTNS